MSSPSAFSPSTVSTGVAVSLDVDEMSDIECGQPNQDFFLAGLDLKDDCEEQAILSIQALDASDDDDEKNGMFADDVLNDSNDVAPVLMSMPNDDRVYIYKARVQEAFDGVIPDYNYAHSNTRMFGKRCSSFRYPSFEFWRRQFDMCRFNIVVLRDDDYNQWADDHLLLENVEMKYLCPHKTRCRHETNRLRVRPVCCDIYNRSCCWVDMSVTFHGSPGILSCGTIGANAPIPSFNVSSASLHPITRTREYFHCGTSFGFPTECNEIDARASTELAFAFGLIRFLFEFLPPVWSEVMHMLNPYEKMIFASMMHDGNAVDDYVHQLRCNRLYGCNVSADEHSMFPGHKQPLVNSNDALRKMMSDRRNSPCQQLMRYGGAYDLTNMLNRHAIRTEIVSEWRYLLLDIGRIMLHRVRVECPEHELCWTLGSHEQKMRYVNAWRSILRYLKVMSLPFDTPDKQLLQHMMYEFDDIIRQFIDTDGLFSYLMSNNTVIRLASCADLSDISWMAWQDAHDVKTLLNLRDWNSGFRTLMCQTFAFLEVDMVSVGELVEIGVINSEIEFDMTASIQHVEWRGRLGYVVKPLVKFYHLYK